jgi:hypothetical protein
MIGRKLLLIDREAMLPIILIGKNRRLKNMVNVVNEHHAIQGFQNNPAAAGAPAGGTRFTAGYFV